MCWDCNNNDKGDPYKNFRRGGVEVEDFEEVTHRHPKRRKKKEKTRPGCPENEYGPHVYVWTTEGQEATFFSDYYGFHSRQRKMCAGCGKVKAYKPSDEYMRIKERKWAKLTTPEKGEPMPRYGRRRHGYSRFNWWLWENEDEDYAKARREYIDRNGWPVYLYDF